MFSIVVTSGLTRFRMVWHVSTWFRVVLHGWVWLGVVGHSCTWLHIVSHCREWFCLSCVVLLFGFIYLIDRVGEISQPHVLGLVERK